MHRIRDSPNIPKRLTSLMSLVIQTFDSEPSPDQFPPSKSQQKTPLLWSNIQLKTFLPLFCISILIVRKFQEVLLFFIFSSIFKLVVPSHHKFKFLQHEFSFERTSIENRGALRCKTVDFIRCIRVLIGQNFQRKPLVNKFSRQ